MVMKRLRNANKDMTVSEAIVKLAIASVFQLFVIAIFTAGAFAIGYYLFKTPLPVTVMITIVGIIIGTLLAFFGVMKIVSYKNKGDDKNNRGE